MPRPTYDADLALDIGESQLPSLLEAFEEGGFEIPEEHRRGFLDRVGPLRNMKVTRLLEKSVWEADLFIASRGFLADALRRRRRRQLDDRSVWVVSSEDLILLKLMAHRRKDQADVEEILLVCRDIDADELRNRAAQLGLSERLAPFLAERR